MLTEQEMDKVITQLNDAIAQYDTLKAVNRKLTTELIQVKEEKAHNEQILDSFQNTLADFGYKLVDINE